MVFAAGARLALVQHVGDELLRGGPARILDRYGCPEIFNTDQGSQFTSEDFTDVLLERGIKISMDGKGRFIDNIFVERLWRSLKYEEVYLYAYDTVQVARAGIARYIDFFKASGRTRR